VVNVLHRYPIIELEPTVRPVDLESGSWVNTLSGACHFVHGEGDISAAGTNSFHSDILGVGYQTLCMHGSRERAGSVNTSLVPGPFLLPFSGLGVSLCEHLTLKCFLPVDVLVAW